MLDRSRVRREVLSRFVQAPRRRQLGLAAGTPTPVFRTIHFELRTRCNSRCSFCAAAIPFETRPDLTMPFSLYAKVIGELDAMGYRGGIAYHVNNDPLVVPDLERYVAHARQRLPSCWIRIMTNGRALSPTRGEALLRAGIDEMTVNWYAERPDESFPPHLVLFRDEVLPRFHPAARVRRGTGPLRPGDRSIFRFNLNHRLLDEVLDSRGGTSPNRRVPEGSPRGFCEYPFTQLNITTDGRVALCCADVFFGAPMGNVTRQTILEIWHGAPFERVRNDLLGGDRSRSTLCRQCDTTGVDLAGAPWSTRLANRFLLWLAR